VHNKGYCRVNVVTRLLIEGRREWWLESRQGQDKVQREREGGGD
jgi:hypothetical protein